MVLKELINKSTYGTIGYISSQDDIDMLESYILYNLPVLKEFKQLIIVTNYKSYPNLVEENNQLWKKYFPDCILINLKVNRGHSFGIADSENVIIDYCKENNIDWLCKASNDVILQEKILNKQIEKADFYYTNGISYLDISSCSFNYNKVYNDHFFPQTNFYIIKVSEIDYIYDKKYIDDTYQFMLTIPNYSNKIWEYIPEWACELFLKRCVERNNLTKYYLLDINTHNKLCETVIMYKIGDPSHKNIMIEGVCHLQYPDQNILEI